MQALAFGRHGFGAVKEGEVVVCERSLDPEASGEASGGIRASCDPDYSGACLDPAASDYDCEGGSGDGPNYTGTVTVVGSDPHGLDSDGDGIGCE